MTGFRSPEGVHPVTASPVTAVTGHASDASIPHRFPAATAPMPIPCRPHELGELSRHNAPHSLPPPPQGDPFRCNAPPSSIVHRRCYLPHFAAASVVQNADNGLRRSSGRLRQRGSDCLSRVRVKRRRRRRRRRRRGSDLRVEFLDLRLMEAEGTGRKVIGDCRGREGIWLFMVMAMGRLCR